LKEDHVQTEYKSSDKAHIIRIVIILVVALILGVAAKAAFVPDDFGKYGHYRAGAIEDEMNREVRHQTNESCLACHPYIKKIHLAGVHKTVSCEFCHGPLAAHAKDGKKFADMPVKRGEEIRTLCLRCHNKIIRARPKESIKMVAMPQHLEEKKVRTEHVCNQCHHVHDPLKWVIEAKKMMGLIKEEKKYAWM
jgi:hypothetical protein